MQIKLSDTIKKLKAMKEARALQRTSERKPSYCQDEEMVIPWTMNNRVFEATFDTWDVL